MVPLYAVELRSWLPRSCTGRCASTPPHDHRARSDVDVGVDTADVLGQGAAVAKGLAAPPHLTLEGQSACVRALVRLQRAATTERPPARYDCTMKGRIAGMDAGVSME